MKTVITQNPLDELRIYSEESGILLNDLDFTILQCETIENTPNGELHYSLNDLKEFDDDERFLNAFELSQTYEILIERKQAPLVEFNLRANKTGTKIVGNFDVLKVNEDAEISELLQDIKAGIYKKLVRAGMLIGLREFNLQKQLIKMLKAFKTKQLTQVNLLIAKGIDPIHGEPGKINYLYKQKTHKKDYATRGFIDAVSDGELIMEFFRPTRPVDGKNIAGEKVEANNGSYNERPSFEIGESILCDELEDRINYYARQDGYVHYDVRDNLYEIKDILTINTAKFRTTGSINGGINKNITLNIEEEKDFLKDAVGANITIEVSTLNVKGNVAQNSTVKAKEVTIGGQTHSKSKIFGRDIKIAVHKGYCEGDNIVIDRLENGIVCGKNVRISRALGGVVKAQKVIFEELNMNTKCEASEYVLIKTCKGENNKFVITASNSPKIKQGLEENQAQIKECDKELAKVYKTISQLKSTIDSNKENIAQIREKMQEFALKNTPPPAVFVTKIKNYQATVRQFNALLQDYEAIKDRKKDYEGTLSILQNKVFEARVINLSTWANMNEIRFKLLYPETNLVYNTSEGEKIYGLKLEKYEENGETKAKIVKFEQDESVGGVDDSLS